MQLSHLLRTDFRQFRLLLVAWIVVQAMGTVYFGLQSFVDTDSRNAGVLAFLGLVLVLGRWLGLAALIPMVMHAHPAVGSDAFWLTRPIPWRTLLLSKAILFTTVFVAVPVLLEAILMSLFRVPLRNIVLVSVQDTLIQALLVAVLMALSALTRSLAGFALVVGGLLLTLALLVNISLVIMMRTLAEGPAMHDVSIRTVSSPVGDSVLFVALIAVIALPVAIQYRSRSMRTTIYTAVLAIASIVGAAFVWPSSDRPLAAPVWSSALQIVVQEPKIEFTALESLPANQPNPWVRGSVRFGLSGVESTWLGTIRLVESSLEFEDGIRVPTAGNGESAMLGFAGVAALPDYAATRDLLGVTGFKPLHDAFAPFRALASAITLRERDFRKYVGTTANYRGRFIVDLDQLQIAGTLPLHPGAEFSAGAERFVLVNVWRNRHSAHVQVRRITTTTMFD